MPTVHNRNDARDYMGCLSNSTWLKLIAGDTENLTEHNTLC